MGRPESGVGNASGLEPNGIGEQQVRNVYARLVIGVVLAVGTAACSNSDALPAAESSVVGDSADSLVDMSPVAADLGGAVSEAISRQSEENVVVLDVRTDEEWNESHAKDAVHWGLEEHISQGELPELDKDAEIYVYCQSGVRAAEAIKIMQDAGFTNLTNIRGLEDWVAGGGETVAGVDGDSQ